MFPFWQDVVAPVIEAVGARRIVEVGALRGENTQLMLERLGPDVELHVVDPLPAFDPAEHEQRFAGQYIFHRDLSVNVLGELPPMDVALIDGDHNWYTVFTELNLLADVARTSDAPLPVMVLHDVGWPYGRRDLYYDPSTIPAEHLHPWRRSGIQRGQSALRTSGGGMNPTLANAEHEGGSHNGVMTGIEDFIAAYEKPLRLLVLPIYFGLAIIVEEARLARQPQLADELDRLESREGKDMLLLLGEDIRLEAAVFDQALLKQRDDRVDRVSARYLESTKRGILNDHHPENEARIHHLLTALANGRPANEAVLRDPRRHAAGLVRRLEERHRTGEPFSLQPNAEPEDRLPDQGLDRQGHATAGRVGLDHLHECLDSVWGTNITGDLAVTGVATGGATVMLAAYLEARDHEVRPALQRKLWVVDELRPSVRALDLNGIRDLLARFDLLNDRIRLLQGDPAVTAADVASGGHLALLYIGPGQREQVGAVLDALYPRLTEGAVVVIEDLDEPGAAEAVEEYRTRHGIVSPLGHAGRAGAHWVKEEPLGAPPAVVGKPIKRTAASRSPLAPKLGYLTTDLSVVIVLHNMRREAVRSLYSLSDRYQQGLDGKTYDVIVVENGSDPDQKVGEDAVRKLGRHFRYLDVGDDATPSPAHALNRGIELTHGRSLALMVDGAHVLTPRVLHYGLAALETYDPAVVAAQAWYVGPGQQGDVMRSGYDQKFEDALFEQISWPDDGYRLFEIGHFVGDRDWFDGVWESNCLFAPRSMLEQVGGFDEAFDMPGGGYTNLDIFERLTSSPEVRMVTILGEGSFHQVHGGMTTNQTEPLERRERIQSYAKHFRDLRGRPFMGPEKPIHFVGGFHSESAKRSRGRRMTATAFEVDAELEGIDGPATEPAVPIADDLRDHFTLAYYRSLAWKNTRWAGRLVPNAAGDLITYQEIVAEVRPDWIIDTGTGNGGRAFFLATICDLVGHGRVVSVSPHRQDDRPEHPRLQYVEATPHWSEGPAAVRAVVGDDPRALVVLGSRTMRQRTRMEFEGFAPLVPVGSYVIIEHTALNGFPVDASFGPGPHEALRNLMNGHPEFLADTERERHGLTFNPGGFLRRIS